MSKIIKKYDENNNLIYWKNENNHRFLERWIKYDKNNNKIHYKDTNDYEVWQEYDENNRIICYKDSGRDECWYKYDENNNREEITEKEFLEIKYAKKQIKNDQEEEKILEKNITNRFKLMDI
ncbi:MAG: hypothetical protein QQN40_07480 [Nitrosopumilus sp.]